MSEHRVTTLAELEVLYDAVNPVALKKETKHLTPQYRRLVEAAPFFAFASVGDGGLDCSPRGDSAGFVAVLDDKTLAIPDRRGNNRIDTLRNIITDPRVALLFLIPGVGETLRINGAAEISTNPELIARFAHDGKPPKSVIIVHIDAVYFQCAKAIVRSKLWDSATQVARTSLPSTGELVQSAVADFDGKEYDKNAPARLQQTLY